MHHMSCQSAVYFIASRIRIISEHHQHQRRYSICVAIAIQYYSTSTEPAQQESLVLFQLVVKHEVSSVIRRRIVSGDVRHLVTAFHPSR
jgi:hypothetical protein